MHYKLYIILGCLLALIACTKSVQAPVAPHASLSDCERVYQQILNDDVAQFLDPNISYSPNDWREAEFELDNYFQATGSREKFMRTCLAHMTPEQVECALHAQHAEDINACVKLLPRK